MGIKDTIVQKNNNNTRYYILLSNYAILLSGAVYQVIGKYTPTSDPNSGLQYNAFISGFPFLIQTAHASTKCSTVKCREHVAETDVQTACSLHRRICTVIHIPADADDVRGTLKPK